MTPYTQWVYVDFEAPQARKISIASCIQWVYVDFEAPQARFFEYRTVYTMSLCRF